jgi:hypothetical protein
LTRLRLWSAAALVACTALAVACDTVDLGPVPADVNACRPSQAFFVSDIWPMFLTMDYGGKHCSDSNCHGAASTNSLRLINPPLTGGDGMGGAAVPLTGDWAANYRSVAEQMNCSNVAASKLLTLPSGQRTHGGGALISPTGPEAMLIKMWVSQP